MSVLPLLEYLSGLAQDQTFLNTIYEYWTIYHKH